MSKNAEEGPNGPSSVLGSNLSDAGAHDIIFFVYRKGFGWSALS
jgi:hypothetical protein